MEFSGVTLKSLKKTVVAVIEEHGLDCNYFLSGGLGAGKTTFVKEAAKWLKAEKPVTSPTFTLQNIYPYNGGELLHLDLYRLSTVEEALEIGLEEILSQPGLKMIEWMNKFPELMKNGVEIVFEIEAEGRRRIKTVAR